MENPARERSAKLVFKSDFQKISERSGVPSKIGKKRLKVYARLFKFWKIEYDPNMLSFKKLEKSYVILKRERFVICVKESESVVATCKQQQNNILARIMQALHHWASTQKNTDAFLYTL